MDNIQNRIFTRKKISIQFTNQKLKYYLYISYEHFKISYLHCNSKKIQQFLQKYLHNSYNFMLNNHCLIFNNSWKSLCILKMNCKINLKEHLIENHKNINNQDPFFSHNILQINIHLCFYKLSIFLFGNQKFGINLR